MSVVHSESFRANSDELFQTACQAIPGGVNSPVRAFGSVGGTPRFIQAAHGPYLLDTEGKTYVDLVCSWGPALLGHAFPDVVEAVREVAGRGLSFGAPTVYEVELAQLISARAPLAEKIRLVSTGTEATMTAIRLARGATNRPLIVKFAGCYHGHSDGLLVAAGSGVATAGLPGSAGVTEAIASQTVVLPYGDSQALRECFAERGEEIAAVITEAAPANMGVVVPGGFNQVIRQVTKEYGALMIFDEVLTGFRIGPAGMWGYEVGAPTTRNADDVMVTTLPDEVTSSEHYYAPDIFTFGKVVGGGMPLAALGARAELMDLLAPLGPVYQAGTLSGNPLATVAGLATLKAATAPIYQRIDTVSAVIQESLQSNLEEAGVPFCINHVGNLFSVFFGAGPARTGVHNYEEAQSQNPEVFKAFFHSMLEQGINLPPSGYEAWFLSSAHTDSAVERILDAIPKAAEAAADVTLAMD